MEKINWSKTIYRVVRDSKIFLTNDISDLTNKELASLNIK